MAEANPIDPKSAAQARRAALMRCCASASADEMEAAVAVLASRRDVKPVRGPECGLVMLRARAGGDGAAFNVGEATVTRASVRIADGPVGHSYILGRDATRARLAAILDALWQIEDVRERVEQTFMTRVAARMDAEAQRIREETAATRVDFFTLVRGEDA